ncbi:efflux RND transporter periplasmic adaptor subunit [Thioalkalivibrio sp. ALJ16]|uniref:efflux RND transporter periplasmic adaptor subunit n=1 Tax=Thioalkalivibrio sp. ALJ16 TaxID=1158762 RepID=UPI0003AA2155|nr:efflux RND transporter periplasmic adaptor subunit [Thioalkalivibrio sp. ALJ16]
MKAIGWLLGLLVVAALGTVAWYTLGPHAPADNAGDEPAAERDDRIPVRTAEVAPRTFETRVESLGTVAASESVTVTASVTERVVEVLFDDGDAVTAGQVLVRLDADEERAALREAQVQVDEARRELERIRGRVEDGVVTRQQVDQQQSRLNEAEARLEAARARVELRTIRAPFAGRLGLRQVSPGALVSPGTAIVELDDIATVKVDFAVPERHAAAIELGREVQGRSSAGAFTGEVTAVANRLDVGTRTLTVRASIDNPDLLLRPGMLLNVRLALDPVERLAVPEGAIQQVADQHFVFRLRDDGTVERTRIRIGRRDPGFAELLDGLEPGDIVVSEGVSRVRDGRAVRVLPAPVAPATDGDEAGQ